MAQSDLVQSVLRSLDILSAVADAEDGLSLQEMARALDVQPSTAHNLARTLLARGFLAKTNNPTRYHLGPAIGELADRQRQRGLRQRAATVLGDVFAYLCDATVTLAEYTAGEIAIVLRMSPERPGVLQRPGSTLSPYGSAASLLFQALWTEAERQAYRQRYPFAEYGSHNWPSLESLDAFLDAVRQRQYAAPATPDDDLVRVAVPVYNANNALIASLGAAAPRCGRSLEKATRRLTSVLLDGARKISQGTEESRGVEPC